MSHPLARPPFDSPLSRGDCFGCRLEQRQSSANSCKLYRTTSALLATTQASTRLRRRMSYVGLWFKKRCLASSSRFRAVSRSQRGRTAAWCRQILGSTASVTAVRKTSMPKKRDNCERKSRWNKPRKPRRFDGCVLVEHPVADDAPTPSQGPISRAANWRGTFDHLPISNRPIANVTCRNFARTLVRRDCRANGDQIRRGADVWMRAIRNSKRFVIWVRPRCAHDFIRMALRGTSSDDRARLIETHDEFR